MEGLKRQKERKVAVQIPPRALIADDQPEVLEALREMAEDPEEQVRGKVFVFDTKTCTTPPTDSRVACTKTPVPSVLP